MATEEEKLNSLETGPPSERIQFERSQSVRDMALDYYEEGKKTATDPGIRNGRVFEFLAEIARGAVLVSVGLPVALARRLFQLMASRSAEASEERRLFFPESLPVTTEVELEFDARLTPAEMEQFFQEFTVAAVELVGKPLFLSRPQREEK